MASMKFVRRAKKSCFDLAAIRLSDLKEPFAFMLALTMALGGQPLLSPVLADGYYDENGNWIEDTGSGGGSDTIDPWYLDTDGDGITDAEEWGGFSVEREVTYETTDSYPAYDSSTGEETWETITYTSTTLSSEWIRTDPYNPDSDFDGLPDGWERDTGFHPLDPTDGLSDLDGDGLPNGAEFGLGTQMWLIDSDGDEFWDAEEVFVLLTDPLDPDDPGAGYDSSGGEGEGNTSGEGESAGNEGGGDGGEGTIDAG